ncbi:MAG TPA: aminotransferase class III-fold pyridoxal phosphate-dependent enzyme [Gemmatimonadota bacterium]|nr:aminotransferase class III-fold pyridoxal phosphate-dependent enzyme [Gemmatimonadota bacterium]
MIDRGRRPRAGEPTPVPFRDPSGNALPRVVAPPPGGNSRWLAEHGAGFEPGPALGIVNGRAPIGWLGARGANVVDVDGNRYVDLTGGFGAAFVGHRNPYVVRWIRDASRRLLHGLADAAPHPLRTALAGALTSQGPIRNGRVFFATSGAEAIDLALKTVHLATGRTGVVAFEGGYHGTSLGALRATGRPAFREPFEDALMPATLRVPYPDCYRCPYRLQHPECGLACLDAALAEVDAWNADPVKPRIGAWVVEPVLGREGVVVPPPGWMAALGEAARERRILIVADEILTGGGRTGREWASGPLKPDLATVGKGITGGMPLAAVLGRPALMKAWESAGEARHAATYMANPVAVAATWAALAEIRRLELPARAQSIGRRLKSGLARIRQRHSAVGDVRGAGALWGIDFVTERATREPDPDTASEISAALARRGYLAMAGGRHGNVIVLTPPAVITDRQLDGFLEALEASLSG